MKEFFEDPYLQHKLEPIRTREEQSHYTSEDLGYGDIIKHDKTYSLPETVFKEKVGETEVLFSYSKPDKAEIIADFNKLKDKGDKKIIKPLLSESILKNIRKVQRLEIKNDTSFFTTGASINQSDPAIYFNVSLESGSGFSKDANSVFLQEDPLSRKGLIILFHELGHSNNYKDISEEEMSLYYSSLKKISYLINFLPSRRLNQEEAKILLEEERRAWAFALKTLRPFEDDLDLDLKNSLETIHNHNLQSYSDVIREEIK